MRPHIAPISDRSRELYGKYQPRYKTISSMRPFDAPISDRNRELFGEYQRRYETQPSMKPFDADISERSRELYGEYRARWSSLKMARTALSNLVDANGTNWVDLTWALASYPLLLHDRDKAVYQYMAFDSGTWAGTPTFRMLVNDQKVYPFPTDDTLDTSGSPVHLGSLSTNVRMGDGFRVQFRSTNAADGAGDWVYIAINYATFE